MTLRSREAKNAWKTLDLESFDSLERSIWIIREALDALERL